MNNPDLLLTSVARRHKAIGGVAERIINVVASDVTLTLTTRYAAMSFANIFSRSHFPMTAVLIEYT